MGWITSYYCKIEGCGALLDDSRYFILILDEGKRIPVCPACYKKINSLRKKGAKNHTDTYKG